MPRASSDLTNSRPSVRRAGPTARAAGPKAIPAKPAASDQDVRTVRPGPDPRHVVDANGAMLAIPASWGFLPPGDPMWTRRVKARGPHWLVQEKVGRKVFSRGLWAPASTIEAVRLEVEATRSQASYHAGLQRAAAKRDAEQSAYVEEFRRAVLEFLRFPSKHRELAERLALAVAEHATPVGSGTVARTQRIPLERRCEAAVIAWMRHQTTAYDHLVIPRVRGARRDVRRQLAERSRVLLDQYRRELPVSPDCPLQRALAG
ncbi:MAG: DUF2293 domain-containing protein [Pirellula sp.]